MITGKATITSLNSLFTPEDTHKAAQRVQDAISARQNDLKRLETFLSENSNLVDLVRSLPDDVSHDIMVPFGGSAFFPGRLIHTNEFLVLLGDGYYADRSSKQTIEILKRREKTLEDQVEATKAIIKDLEAEAMFFESTATEALEGIVYLREEYIEDLQQSSLISGDSDFDHSGSNGDNLLRPDKDEEYEHARIMKILNQLEMNELESGSVVSCDEENKFVAVDGDKAAETTSSYSTHDTGINVLQKNIERDGELEYFGSSGFEKSESSSEQHLADQCSVFESGKHFMAEVDMKEKVPPMYSDVKTCENSSSSTSHEAFRMHSDAPKAFTGSVIEHDLGLQPIESSKSIATGKPSAPNPSKPVSKFKMQRGNR